MTTMDSKLEEQRLVKSFPPLKGEKHCHIFQRLQKKRIIKPSYSVHPVIAGFHRLGRRDKHEGQAQAREARWGSNLNNGGDCWGLCQKRSQSDIAGGS